MNTMQVEFVITEQCNLGCSYCYMDNQGTFMSLETALKFKDNVPRLMKAYNAKVFHTSYFGGEPLLNWKLIEDLVPILNKDPLCASQMVISNCLLLTQEKLDFLRSHNVPVSFSFDGIWSNTSRPLYGGGESLPYYLEKRDFFQQLGGCKTMVGPQCVSTLVENYKFFIDDYGFNFPDFSLVRDDIWSWEDVEVFKTNLTLLADEVIKRFNKGETQNCGLFKLALMDMYIASQRGKRPFGCFAGCHGVGFFPDGIFYPCARYGAKKLFPLLDTKDDILLTNNIDHLQQPKFCNPIEYEGCQGCSIRRYCTGGCNKSLYDKGNGIKAEPIPQLCEMYKAEFAETMRINKELKGNQVYQNYVKNLIGMLRRN